jgi:hypothetical protein
MKAKFIGSYPVLVESLNSSRGAVNTDSLDDMSDEEI